MEVKKMMMEPKNELNYEILNNYYRHTIYFVQKEVNLFQLYIFALSINVWVSHMYNIIIIYYYNQQIIYFTHFRDLLQQKIEMFHSNMEKTLENTKMLMDQVNAFRAKYANMTSESMTDKGVALQVYFDKVDKLISAANQIKMKFMCLKEDNHRLRDNAQNINCAENLLEL